MLTIRRAQLDALAVARRSLLIADLLLRVQTAYPASCELLGSERSRQLVSDCIDLCVARGWGGKSRVSGAVLSAFRQTARLAAGPDETLRQVMLEVEVQELRSMLETIAT